MKRVIVAGNRTITDSKFINEILERYCYSDVEIVSGGAQGVDKIGEEYGKAWSLPVKVFPADWIQHGKAAGVLRNEEMAKYADTLVAFWDGKSKGTKDMINNALKHNLEVHVYVYKNKTKENA